MRFAATLILLMIVAVNSYSQIAEFTKLPIQSSSNVNIESVPLWISGNEIMIFYTSPELDTIYSIKSTNRGISWGDLKIVQLVELKTTQESLYLTSLRLNTGRLLLAWSVFSDSMKLIHSDDNGSTWSQPLSIKGYGSLPFQNRNLRFLNLSKQEDESILLSFTSINGTGFFKKSYDGGLTWLDEDITIFGVNSQMISVEQIGIDSLVGVYFFNSSIYSKFSFDNGENWSDKNLIAEINPGTNTALVRMKKQDDGTLTLVYNELFETGYDGYSQYDIFVLESADKGISWQSSGKLTKYLGDDMLGNLSNYGNHVFISFSSPRNNGAFQIYYGIISESIDAFTPPVILNTNVPLVDYEAEEFVYRALVIDDDEVSSVYVDLENGVFTTEMFDDGLHNDSLAQDHIFGNIFPVLTPTSAFPFYSSKYLIDVNKISMPFNNAGVIADVDYSSLDLTSLFNITDINNNASNQPEIAHVPVLNPGSTGRYEEGTFLWSGGFWLSGYTNNSLWANGVASAALVHDYLPGKVGSNPEDDLNRIYIVKKDDLPFGSTWQNWKDAVSLGAEFYDGDSNGIYNPIDKNWNGTWEPNEDMPLILGDVTAWCVYNDGRPDSLRRWQSEPQGIEIRQSIFATSLSELDHVLFIRYSILNNGLKADTLTDVYFGIWEDGDLGDHTDDKVGCDILLNSSFYYNSFSDAVYGEDCPSFFTSFIQGPVVQTDEMSDTATLNYGTLIGSESMVGAENLNITSHVFFIGGDPDLSDPSNVIEARNFLKGKSRTGWIPDPRTFPYCEVRGGVNYSEIDPHLWASGDPVTDIGWISVMNVDHRNLVSTGPFKLVKDKPQEIIIAYVLGRGTDYYNSITVARENVRRAIAEYESNFASMTYSAPPPTNPVTSYVLYQNYPNPFNPTTTIRYELPQDGIVTLEIYDILGQKARTILNEFKRADRYEVSFDATGLASGIYIYQLKVNEFITSKKMVFIK